MVPWRCNRSCFMFRPGFIDNIEQEPKNLTGANSDSMIPHESSKGMTSLIHGNIVSFLHELLLDNDELIHISQHFHIFHVYMSLYYWPCCFSHHFLTQVQLDCGFDRCQVFRCILASCNTCGYSIQPFNGVVFSCFVEKVRRWMVTFHDVKMWIVTGDHGWIELIIKNGVTALMTVLALPMGTPREL